MPRRRCSCSATACQPHTGLPSAAAGSRFLAEVALLYQMPRGLPLFVTLGYRYQWFKNSERAGTTREELSVLILGAGVRQVRLQVPKG